MDSAMEHLRSALPHFSEMAVIEVDTPTGGSWSWAGGDGAMLKADEPSDEDE